MKRDNLEKFIEKWRYSFKNDPRAQEHIVLYDANKLKEDGFTKEEALEMLVADGNDEAVCNKVLKYCYDVSGVTGEEDDQLKLTITLSPKCYDDVKDIVENSLEENGPKQFMDKLSGCKHSVIQNLSNNKFDSFVRLAALAKENDNFIDTLHTTLIPFVENAMYESVLRCEKGDLKNKISKKSDKEYVVASHNVNIDTCECDCARFQEGNYKDFGLSCEHIIAVADSISPYDKIIVAINKD